MEIPSRALPRPEPSAPRAGRTRSFGDTPPTTSPPGPTAIAAPGPRGALRLTATTVARPGCGVSARSGSATGSACPRTTDGHLFAPPTLETVVEPVGPADRRALHLALTQLAEQDPLIGLRHDEVRQETSVSLYGEVQKEVVQATLADDYGLDVAFRETTPLCVERLTGTGAACRQPASPAGSPRAAPRAAARPRSRR
ncbi:hypothetical protein SUDANB105_00346 [Streptomyces sp. enrichment culture]